MHSESDTTLGASADVISVPGDTHGDVGVDSGRGEEGSCVLHTGLRGGDEHGEADDGDEAEEDHVGTTLPVGIGDLAGGDGAQACDNVRRDLNRSRVEYGNEMNQSGYLRS